MNTIETGLSGVLIVEPKVFGDARGYFFESWNRAAFEAAGITNGQQVYDFIMAGSEAAGAASGIMNAADPIAMIDEMIAATRRAADDLKKM